MIYIQVNDFKTLEEWLLDNPTANIFQDMDPATEKLVKDHFMFRRVCDNQRFGHYFKRTYAEIELQYLNYLKIEKIDINPLLTVVEASSTGRSTKTTNTTSVTNTGNNTQTQTNTGNITESLTGTSTTNNDTVVTVTGEVDNSITGITTETRDSDTTSNTTTSQDTVTTTTNESTTTDVKDEKNNTKNLQGTTPQSSTYATVDPVTGMPANLNWGYTSVQAQTLSNVDTTTTTTTDSEEGVIGSVNTTTTGTIGVEETGTTNTTTTSAMDSSETSTTDGTVATTDNRTVTTSKDDEISVVNNITGSTETTNSSEICDKDYTNREVQGEAAQDLLKRAISYIKGTNAIRWLFDELEICFLNIFE